MKLALATGIAICAAALAQDGAAPANAVQRAPVWTSKALAATAFTPISGVATLTPLTDTATVFDRFKLTVTLTGPREFETQGVSPTAGLPVEWLAAPASDWATTGGGDTGLDFAATATATLEPLTPGDLPIALVIPVDGGTIRFSERTVSIQSVAQTPPEVATAEPSEARPTFGAELPVPWLLITLVALGVLATLALIAAAIVLITRLASREPTTVVAISPGDTRPPATIALEELEVLIARGHVERREFEPFFDGAAGILRRFIERSLGVRAPRLTTDEFLREARRSSRFQPSDTAEISSFLATADTLKFARGNGTTELADHAVGTIKRFVSHASTNQPTEQPATEADREGAA